MIYKRKAGNDLNILFRSNLNFFKTKKNRTVVEFIGISFSVLHYYKKKFPALDVLFPSLGQYTIYIESSKMRALSNISEIIDWLQMMTGNMIRKRTSSGYFPDSQEPRQ